MRLIKGLLIALLVMGSFVVSNVSVLNSEILAEETKRKTRKTPALRERVYSQLARAQKLADEGQVQEGLDILNGMKSRLSQMNSYERAMLWNFLAFIYYGEEKVTDAIEAFAQVIAQENIPESLEMTTLFSLAQLSMSIEKYNDTLTYLDRWEALATDKTNRTSAHTLRANAYYAAKKYPEALAAIDAGIDGLKKDELPKENWLVLKRALHYELKQTEAVTETTKRLVKLYDKPKYWIELANLYGELGEEGLHLAIMEAAYQQGYVEQSRDKQTLAQLYYYSGAPYKAAKLLSNEIENRTIAPDLKIYTFLAQCWEAAHELDKAIEVLKEAVGLTNDHDLLQRLARLHIDMERWNEALQYAEQAENILEHVEIPGNVFVAKGIALLNLQRFNESIAAFKKAKDIKSTSKIATQWLKFAERESELYESRKQSAELSE